MLSALDSCIVGSHSQLLDSSAAELERDKAAGTHDGAVNFSQGVGKADDVQEIYDQAKAAWTGSPAKGLSIEQSQALTRNLANAFDLDERKLLDTKSPDGAVERSKLQQALVDRVNDAVDSSSQVRASRARYAEAVTALADDHVSVVVSAGNSGYELGDLAADGNHKVPDVGSTVKPRSTALGKKWS